ncbi:hypothetical protein ADK35_10755, partial [Streptomyces viridochromogenes]
EERVLCEVFADVLGLPRVGVDDNFFELGGHSLLATRLVSRVRTALSVELSMRDLFDNPTVTGLAARMEQPGRTRPAVTVRERPDVLPLSFAQRRLWFLNELEGPNPAYHTPMAVRLTGALDQEALRAALGDIVVRHEALRTVFPAHLGQPRQKVLAPEDLSPLLTVTPAGADRTEAIREAALEPFELSSRIPFRATLFTAGPDDHVLLLVLHHIAVDGWSLAPLVRDLSAAYAARCQGKAPDWAPLPVQYADYTLWQDDLLGDKGDSDSDASRQLTYWRSALADLPEELVLPTDRPRPAAVSHVSGEIPLRVPAETHRQLVSLAQEQGSTVFMVLESALAVLLFRLGCGTDIPIGTPVAGRTDDALDELVGFFVNTLVLRTDLSGDPRFVDVLARVKERWLSALAHQDLPFDQLVEDLAPARVMARHPLFQVMFVLQNNSRTELCFPGVNAEPLPVAPLPAKFDLDFSLSEEYGADGSPAGLDGTLNFSAALFDRATAEGIADRFARLLRAVVADPHLGIGELDVLGEAERHRLLVDWQGTAVSVPSMTLSDLFEAQVARDRDAVALEHGETELSYGELNARANRLARHLTGHAVGPEDVVAVRLERSPELVVVLLAVLKTGAAYLPVDPEYPAERIAYMLDDARPALVIDASWLASVDLTGTSDDSGAGTENLPAVNPDHPAYVMYTSGSTGRPKGVVVPHRGVVNWLLWLQEEYGLRTTDRVLQKTPFGFDVSVREFFWPLMTGATLVMAEPGGHKDPVYLAEVIRSRRVTVVHFVPSMLQAFLDESSAAHCTGLRHVLCSGEALPAQLAARFRAVLDVPLHNLYGPTEASVEVTYSQCGQEGDEASIPIGRPLPNIRVYVLDGGLRPVPVGVAGELYVAGVGLARGYLG